MKKVGTIIALNSRKLKGEVYLAENNHLTPNIEMAKAFRASAKVLDTIRAQAVGYFPELKFTASNIERWSD